MSFFRRRSPIPLLVALLSALLIGCVWLAAGPEEVLAAAPAIALAVALAFNRYPGEKLIASLARRLRPRRRPVSRIAPGPRADSLFGLTLLLLAAVRPLRGPPLLSSRSI